MSNYYLELKRLSKELGRSMPTLLAMADNNDPFYISGAREKRAYWFADIWERFGFGDGAHLRRVHYRVISQKIPFKLPNGEPYLNNWSCWCTLKDGAETRDTLA